MSDGAPQSLAEPRAEVEQLDTAREALLARAETLRQDNLRLELRVKHARAAMRRVVCPSRIAAVALVVSTLLWGANRLHRELNHTIITLETPGVRLREESLARLTRLLRLSVERTELRRGQAVIHLDRVIYTEEKRHLRQILTRMRELHGTTAPPAPTFTLEITEEQPKILDALALTTGERHGLDLDWAAANARIWFSYNMVTKGWRQCCWDVPLGKDVPWLEHREVTAERRKGRSVSQILGGRPTADHRFLASTRFKGLLDGARLRKARKTEVARWPMRLSVVFETERAPEYKGLRVPEVTPGELSDCAFTVLWSASDAFFAELLLPGLARSIEDYDIRNGLF